MSVSPTSYKFYVVVVLLIGFVLMIQVAQTGKYSLNINNKNRQSSVTTFYLPMTICRYLILELYILFYTSATDGCDKLKKWNAIPNMLLLAVPFVALMEKRILVYEIRKKSVSQEFHYRWLIEEDVIKTRNHKKR